MKRLVRIVVWLVLLLVAALVGLTLALDSLVRRGVETVGPQLTKTDLKLSGVKLSLLSGKGEISGFLLGNPQGYKGPSSIEVRRASLALVPRSLFSDKIVVRSIQVEAPEVTLEGGLKNNNLSKILENIQGVSRGTGDKPKKPGQPREKTKPGQTKIQVDEFILKEAKVHYAVPVLGGQKITVTLPSVELKGLGQNPEGITVAELAQKVLEALNHRSVQAVGDSMTKLGGDSAKALQDLAKGALNDPDKALQSIGGLLKKKE